MKKHTPDYFYFIILALAGALAFGCGRRAEQDAAPAGSATAPTTPAAAPGPTAATPTGGATPAATAPVTTTRPAAPEIAPFRVTAIVDQGDGHVRAGLATEDDQITAIVRAGDDFEGYWVEMIDADRQEVLLNRDGKTLVARMAPGRQQPVLQPPETPAAPLVTSLTRIEGMQTFEPTEDEIQRGIDPNDPATWPHDYRGPGIERAGIGRPTFTATPEEAEQGIDPNNPDTWPSGYRGPGIERALRAIQQP